MPHFFRVLPVAFLCLLCARAEASPCSPASSETACLGLECERIGETTMDADKKNILACLYDDSATPKLKWKSMSASGTSSNVGGCFAITPVLVSTNNWTSTYVVRSIDPLPAGLSASDIATVTPNGPTVSCKAGYTRSGCVGHIPSGYFPTSPVGIVAKGCATQCYQDSSADGNPSPVCSTTYTICCKAS